MCRPQDQPPYYLIDVSVRPRLFYPAPVLTLGGLVVAPGSGQVLRPDGRPVEGLYAAGRTAAGLCSRSYVSGLSLADCVFSGRRAGRHAALPRARVSYRETMSASRSRRTSQRTKPAESLTGSGPDVELFGMVAPGK